MLDYDGNLCYGCPQTPCPPLWTRLSVQFAEKKEIRLIQLMN